MREIFHSVGWAVNKIASDYGIDFDNQIFEQGKATGEWFKVQLKSSENTQYSAKGDFISETLDKMHVVHFSTEMRDPVLLIHADVKAKRTFWFAPQLSPPVSVDDPRSTVSIRIPTENELPKISVQYDFGITRDSRQTGRENYGGITGHECRRVRSSIADNGIV
jgi:hypothetical protein